MDAITLNFHHEDGTEQAVAYLLSDSIYCRLEPLQEAILFYTMPDREKVNADKSVIDVYPSDFYKGIEIYCENTSEFNGNIAEMTAVEFIETLLRGQRTPI